MLKGALTAIGMLGWFSLAAQEYSDLSIAKALDEEISQLSSLTDKIRSNAIRDLALRIRKQPDRYIVTLAWNLSETASEASGRDTLQEVTTTLEEALRKAPREQGDSAYLTLAELSRYSHMHVSLKNPGYTAMLSKLEADDQRRSEADFTLTDVRGRKWQLKALVGQVVLVNFWATWCPPCRRELPDLELLSHRFQKQGLVILAVSDEDTLVIRKFLSEQKVSYPVLPDPGQKVRHLFGVAGIPQSFVYDREGHLVATAVERPTMDGFVEMLAQAGLK